MLVQGSQDLTAHDPATGKRIWSLKGGFSTIPSPSAGGGLVFAPGGKLTALRPGTATTDPQIVWDNGKLSTGYSSPLYYQGLVYALNAKGILNCADAKTGKILWTERLEGNFSASPLAADGKIYAASEEGVTSVLEAGKEAKVLAANSISDTFLASPVAADGAVFLRSDKRLYCISGK